MIAIEVPKGPATARTTRGRIRAEEEDVHRSEEDRVSPEEISTVERTKFSAAATRRRERRNACSAHWQYRNGTVRCKCCTMLITNHYHRRHRDQHQPPPPPGYVTAHTIEFHQHTSNRGGLIVIVIAGRPRFFLRKKLPRRSLSPSAASTFHRVCKHAYTPCHVPRRRATIAVSKHLHTYFRVLNRF